MRACLPAGLAAPLAAAAVGVCAASAPAAPTGPCPTIDASAVPGDALSVTSPASPTLVGSTVARLSAVIGLAGAEGSYLVEYGPTTDYGLCTVAVELPPVSGLRAITVVLTGLTPGTPYHFRLVATDAAGTALGPDQAVRTLPAGRLPQETTIAGIAVGGMSRGGALYALRALIASPAHLAFRGRSWSVSRTTLGARVAGARVVAAAARALPGRNFSASITVDRDELRAYLAAASTRYGRAPQPPLVGLAGQHAVVVRARPGVGIAVRKAMTPLVRYLESGRRSTLRLLPRTLPAPRLANEKAVVIRLEAQTLTTYVGGKRMLTTPVTTGRPALPTPVGSYRIQARYSPYTFISPWPQGSPYWYPPAPVTWAMPFYDNDFLHDDPAEPEGAYGAGSEYGPYASHGCVHVPHDVMAFLFNWLPIGTPVIVADN